MKPVDQLTEDEFADLVRGAIAMSDAPEALVRSAITLWTAAPASTPLLADAARRLSGLIHAVLGFDSWSVSPMAVGVRALPSATRHLVFNAEGRDIDLRIGPAGDAFRISGQILGPDEAGSIELRDDSDGNLAPPRHAAPLDELGEFRLDGIGAGRYRARLHLADEVVELPVITVGDRTS